jgi:hypothetical protein
MTAGYASAATAGIAASPQADTVSESVENELTRSFASAANTAERALLARYAAEDGAASVRGGPRSAG